MSSTDLLERDNQLLAVGAQCSHPSCQLVDFLPFTCAHCKDKFCQDHFKVEDHSCEHYDQSKHDRIAPNCPLCNSPVAIPPGQNPNIRMEAHLRNDCSVMTGKTPKKSGPICANGKCGKVLFAPITCDKCRQQFCPSHRFPSDHTCNATGASASKPTSPNIGPAFKSTANILNAKATAAKAAVDSKIQKGLAAATTASASSNSASSQKPASSIKLPYNKQDRRAKAEKESRRKALKEREKKGLLSEREKQILAEEEAELAAASHDKKDCLIM